MHSTQLAKNYAIPDFRNWRGAIFAPVIRIIEGIARVIDPLGDCTIGQFTGVSDDYKDRMKS